MPIIIDEVRSEIEPERRTDRNMGNRPPRPAQPPREVELEKFARDSRFYERRLRRLRAD